MDEKEIRLALGRVVPAIVKSQLTSDQKTSVVSVYRERPGTVAAISQKALTANHPHAYFLAAIARVVDELSQQPQPRRPPRDPDAVDCKNCADTGFVWLHDDDAAPCFCPIGEQKQQRLGTTHYTNDGYDPIVVEQPLISLVDYTNSPAGLADPHLAASRKLWQRRPLPEPLEEA